MAGYKKDNHFKDGVIDLLAGSAGGIANVLSGNPLDVVKVKMQTFAHVYNNNWVTCLSKTFTTGGVKGLYAGTVPSLASNIDEGRRCEHSIIEEDNFLQIFTTSHPLPLPYAINKAENAVLFCAYGSMQKLVCKVLNKKDPSELNPLQCSLGGGMASVFAALVLCPTELIKCKLQTQKEINPRSNISASRICLDIWRNQGFKGFFDGLLATCFREVPGYAAFFYSYEWTRNIFTRNGQITKDDIGLCYTALSGSISGVILWSFIFPFDTVKSKMQTETNSKKTFIGTFKEVYHQGGLKIFYRGLTPTLIRTFVASGALFVSYEYSKRFLHCAF